MSEQEPGVGLKQLFLRGKGGSWVLVGVFKGWSMYDVTVVHGRGPPEAGGFTSRPQIGDLDRITARKKTGR